MRGLPEFTADEVALLFEACEMMRAQFSVADLAHMLSPASHSVVLRACALVHADPVPDQPGALRLHTAPFRVTAPGRESGEAR